MQQKANRTKKAQGYRAGFSSSNGRAACCNSFHRHLLGPEHFQEVFVSVTVVTFDW